MSWILIDDVSYGREAHTSPEVNAKFYGSELFAPPTLVGWEFSTFNVFLEHSESDGCG